MHSCPAASGVAYDFYDTAGPAAIGACRLIFLLAAAIAHRANILARLGRARLGFIPRIA
jgi:hypothetical protein